MQSETFFKLFKAKNLIFITNYLQLINALELYHQKKIYKNILVITDNKKIFKRKKIINIISNIYNVKKLNICHIDNKININSFLNLFLLFLLKNYVSIINGNFFVDKFNLFIFLRCQNKYFVDDGTSTLLLNEKNNTQGKLIKIIKFIFKSFNFKITFFTSYNKFDNIFQYKIKNNYDYLKKKLSIKKININEIYILGTSLINTKEYLSEKDYIDKIKNIESKFTAKKISYFPHPREKISKNFRNFLLKKKIKLVSTDLPIEIYLLNCSSFPKGLISFYSSAFIVFKIIFKNKLNLFYYDDKLILNKFQKYGFFSDYFSKNFKKLKI